MRDVDASLLERVRTAFTGLPRGPRRLPAAQRCRRVRVELIDLFAERLADGGTRVHRVSPATQDATLALLQRDGTASVCTAGLGIATTGTVVLAGSTEPTPPRPDAEVDICVLHESRVVLGVPEALALLGRHRPRIWSGSPDLIESEEPEGSEAPAPDRPRFELVLVGSPM